MSKIFNNSARTLGGVAVPFHTSDSGWFLSDKSVHAPGVGYESRFQRW
jgi:hypothetical protein